MATKKATKATTFDASSTLMLNGVAVNVSAFHKALHAALVVKGKADETAKAALYRVVSENYHSMPDYEAYAADHKALRAQCETDGTSYDYQRKEYNGAIMSLFKGLPVSTSPEAAKKAAQRKLKKMKEQQALISAGLKNQPKNWVPVPLDAGVADSGNTLTVPKVGPGAPKGEVKDQKVSMPENVEQMIARFGIFEVIEGLTRVLAVDKSTEMPAKTLAAIAAQLRRTKQPAKKAA